MIDRTSGFEAFWKSICSTSESALISTGFFLNSVFNKNSISQKKPDELKRIRQLHETAQSLEKISYTVEKTCLFIGRALSEPLPKENGVFWLSSTPYYEESNSEERLHFWLDFSDDKQLTCLHHCFDKIIIDVNETKCFEGDFITRLTPLLKLSEESELVFEMQAIFANTLEMTGIQFDVIDEGREFFSNYEENAPEEMQREDHREFEEIYRQCLTGPEEEKINFRNFVIQKRYQPCMNKLELGMQDCIKKTKKQLKKYFHSITFVESPDFYYPTEKQPDGEKFQYFIAKGIKKGYSLL